MVIKKVLCSTLISFFLFSCNNQTNLIISPAPVNQISTFSDKTLNEYYSFFVKKVFSNLDDDKDDFLSKTELINSLTTESFDKLDKDKDSKISLSEATDKDNFFTDNINTVSNLFKDLDNNRNSYLEKSEIDDFFSNAKFETFDINNDTKLSIDEVVLKNNDFLRKKKDIRNSIVEKFFSVNTDHDEYITPLEFSKVYKPLGNVSAIDKAKVLANICMIVDLDGDARTINFTEFEDFYIAFLHSMPIYKDAFPTIFK